MAFIKESYLREQRSKNYLVKDYIVKTASLAQITVFLSHSHKDRDLAEGFQNALASCEIKVYVDWQDHTLSQTPDRKTAKRIKDKIRESDLFIFLATNNSLSSRWCPWEIGFADSVKGYENILIVPVVDDSGEFKGNEYLQLYKRVEIEHNKNKLWVIEPEFGKFGEKFSEISVKLSIGEFKFNELFKDLCSFLKETYEKKNVKKILDLLDSILKIVKKWQS